MKQLLLSTSLLLGFLTMARAQAGTNLDFEKWTSHIESEPNAWVTNNVYTPQVFAFCTKVTGFSGLAVHLETISTGGLAIPGSMANTHGNYLNGEGGIDYLGSTIPTHIKGQCRYDIKPNDSAMIYIVLKKNGSILSRDSFYIKGSQSSFTSFSYPLSPFTMLPDSLVVAASSGAFSLMPGAPSGSYLELDNLALSDGTATYPILNADFNTWNTSSVDVADSWGTNGTVYKTTDKYSGTYAAKLISADDGTGTIVSGGVYNTVSIGPKTDTLTGYYKYATAGADAGFVQVILNDLAHTNMQQLSFTLQPAANYTYFSIPLANTINAAEASFIISSSQSPAVDGSTLYLDNIVLKKAATSVDNVATTHFNSYPNPVYDVWHISLKNTDQPVTITITDAKGSKVAQQESRGVAEVAVPVNKLAPGLYFYEIRQGENVMTDKLLIKH